MTEEELHGALHRLCERHGVATGYADVWGVQHAVPPERLVKLLRECGVELPADGPVDAARLAQAEADAERADWHRALPPVKTMRAGADSFSIALRLPGDVAQIEWRVADEAGAVHEGAVQTSQLSVADRAEVDGKPHLLYTLEVALALPMGYHLLSIAGHAGETLLVCAPAQCHRPPALEDDGRLWGLTLQLYGLRSRRNWGIGDFSDLAVFAAQAAREGAGVIGLNPLHALFPHNPAHTSPYSPSSRAQLNPLYIDVEAVPDFWMCEPARLRVESVEFQARLAELRETALVDHAGVAAAKYEILELLYANFRQTLDSTAAAEDPEVAALMLFRKSGGAALQQHALFEALQAHLHRADESVWGWPVWPEPYRDMDGPAVADFARQHAERIGYFEYLQWQAARQLEAAGQQCRTAGMPVGLYLDLAVSVDRGGSDAWRHRACFATGASVGAPPDVFNPNGQDWGLPPLRPDRLRETHYRVFIEALRANMRGAGAIRIDHVMVLMRLFWIPAEGSARDGAYVHYPFEELLAILALESERHRCLVIGEDLGTVPEAMRDALGRYGVLSYRLLYFERGEGGAFRQPGDYPRDAVVAVSTHDLATLAGWWSARDLQTRLALDLFPDRGVFEQQMRERAQERSALVSAMQQVPGLPGTLPNAQADGAPLAASEIEAVHAFLAAAPSKLMMVQLEDALGELEQPNLPGTTVEHPNWRRKYGRDLEAVWSAAEVQSLCRTMARSRPSAAIGEEGTQGAPLRVPRATYRLQLHKGFTLDDAAGIVPYLAKLGISHVYCSPIHRARPGSLHGYDVLAHDEINPELGGMPAFERFTGALKQHGMGQILDLVPNHMGVLGAENPWWMDVLRNGQASAYANHFDIDWKPLAGDLAGKVLLPVLGKPYGEALESGELELRWHEDEDSFSVHYYDHRFPLSPQSSAELKRQGPAALPSHGALHAVLEAQSYRLAHWRVASDEINYRRFFDVNDLAALRMEREDVFEATHAMVLDLVAKGWVDGLRIDHPDGLHDPAQYFERLQESFAKRTGSTVQPPDADGRPHRALYVVAEKIAAPHEEVPVRWAVHGTTGYRFANMVNAVLVDHRAAERIGRIWRSFTGVADSFEEVTYKAKREVAHGALASDLEVLAHRLLAIAKADRATRDCTLNGLREMLVTVVASLTVYRTYNAEAASEQDVHYIDLAIAAARKRMPLADASMFDFVRSSLLGQAVPGATTALQEEVLRFARRFQQFSAPVAAKGVEDTAFYRYFPLSSCNEVGGEPNQIGVPVAEFHEASEDRQRRWSHTMLATSTHDNKRSEDVRLRIDVLSEMTAGWRLALGRWRALNAPLRSRARDAAGRSAPSSAHEYLLYQTLLGSIEPEDVDAAMHETYVERIAAYMRKAAREGKDRTRWTQPDAAYEKALEQFVRDVLALRPDNRFLSELRRLAAVLNWYGALNGLSLALIKYASAGVPDVYQGCESIDHSLVDPDNRRPVDYAQRADWLAEFPATVCGSDGESDGKAQALIGELAALAESGRAKLWLTARLLDLRRRSPVLFSAGTYLPLEVRGPQAAHVVAFMRRHENRAVIVIAGRLFALLDRQHRHQGAFERRLPLGEANWQDTRVMLPDDFEPQPLQDWVTGATHTPDSNCIALANVFGVFPGAVLVAGETILPRPVLPTHGHR